MSCGSERSFELSNPVVYHILCMFLVVVNDISFISTIVGAVASFEHSSLWLSDISVIWVY
jgi:hypothetical protein